MPNAGHQPPPEDPAVLEPQEARQGKILKRGSVRGTMRVVLIISMALAVAGVLIVLFAVA